ncbi:sugar phosphate nucleotidyltransferase [Thalassotalea sp. G2M2-11]|uniref:sugar phosphate nucleotidyltransferase n=1 Tax=Thalassotalea sp. G2M2-11 TaxID=2787627 RepID=UPI0019D037EB|nr:sugar phosphate nucleotidyltransferase [Thalassotalea sp. G2M2-11]
MMTNNNPLPVVVLAGGLGTRLRSVVADKPKIMAPINDIPFVEILLKWLKQQGMNRVIFSLGYKAELVLPTIKRLARELCLDIDTVIEPSPKGTLGGLNYTLSQTSTGECIVINGDTFIDVDLTRFVTTMQKRQSDMGIGVVEVPNVARFGQVKFKNDEFVAQFIEKDEGNSSKGWINAGVYYFSADTVSEFHQYNCGSIEQDFLIPQLNRLHYFKVELGLFIDIGTPESFKQAAEVLREYCI